MTERDKLKKIAKEIERIGNVVSVDVYDGRTKEYKGYFDTIDEMFARYPGTEIGTISFNSSWVETYITVYLL